MTEPPVRRCPRARCAGTVERLIGGGAGLIFKGSGFYITDYKKSPPSKKTSEAKPEKKSDKTSG